jgi:hypothetical protein
VVGGQGSVVRGQSLGPWVSGKEYSGFWFLVSGFWFLGSGFWFCFRISDFGFLVAGSSTRTLTPDPSSK